MSLDCATTDCADRWPVMVVCQDAMRVTELMRALGSWPVPVAPAVVAGAMPALRHALSQPLRLAVVDWALDGPSGQALVRQLGRLRPQLPVLAFDTLGVEGPADQVLAWPWSELGAVLDHWLLLRQIEEHGVTEGPNS